MALLLGLLLVAVTGMCHQAALRILEIVSGPDRNRPNLTIATVFIGLLLLHTVEILGWAAAYKIMLEWPAFDWIGALEGDPYTGSWGDLIYFSGVQYATLGYTQIKAVGPIRLVSMMESLGGFMVLTWSATYIYSAWQRAFRLVERRDERAEAAKNG